MSLTKRKLQILVYLLTTKEGEKSHLTKYHMTLLTSSLERKMTQNLKYLELIMKTSLTSTILHRTLENRFEVKRKAFTLQKTI